MLLLLIIRLVPRPSAPPVLIAYSMPKNEGRRPGESYHVIHSTAGVMDSRCNGFIHIFINSYREATQALEKK